MAIEILRSRQLNLPQTINPLVHTKLNVRPPSDVRDDVVKHILSAPKENFNFNFEQAIKITKDRLATVSVERKQSRLSRRLENLEVLRNFLSTHPNAELKYFLGWGAESRFSKANSNVSQFDTAFVSIDGDLVALQLDSSVEIQQLESQFEWSDGDKVEHHTLKIEVDSESEKLRDIFEYQEQSYSRESLKEVDILSTDSEDNGFKAAFSKASQNSLFCGASEDFLRAMQSQVNIVDLKPTTRHRCSSHSCSLHHAHHNHDVELETKPKPSSFFEIEEIKHSQGRIFKTEHSHFKLKSVVEKEEKACCSLFKMIDPKSEGCPCCTAGLDFDEFAAAVIKIINQSSETGHSSLHSLADFHSSVHLGVSLGVAFPFAVVGLVAAKRNVEGCWDNLKVINEVISSVGTFIEGIQRLGGEHYVQDDDIRNAVVTRLEAYKDTLEYSKFDTRFNLAIPGVVNGAASSFVLSSVIWHNPFALPVIAGYSAGQLARNLYDLSRVWNRQISHQSTEELQGLLENSVDQDVISALKEAGEKKANQIGESKRAFHASNALGFASFTVGAVLTFISIPALAVGVGAATLPIGLALLGAGAASTGVMNNIWPIKFKPANGDLGVDRTTLTLKKCLEELGARREQKTLLKESKERTLEPNTFRKFLYKVLSAMPWGEKPGERYRHADNLRLFKEASGEFARHRNTLLSGLLRNKSLDSSELDHRDKLLSNLDNSSITGKDRFDLQWDVCKELGIQEDVINVFIEDFFEDNHAHHDHHHHHHHAHGDHHSHINEEGESHRSIKKKISDISKRVYNYVFKSNDSCCGHAHTDEDFRHMLSHSDLFVVEDDGRIGVDTSDFKARKSLGKAIDFYLHNGYIERLRYQQYGLDEYYWALKKRIDQQSA